MKKNKIRKLPGSSAKLESVMRHLTYLDAISQQLNGNCVAMTHTTEALIGHLAVLRRLIPRIRG